MPPIDFEYGIGEKVEIIDLKIEGYVCSLWCSDRGPQYEVAYWVDAERKKEYLFPAEIRSLDKKHKKIGFEHA